MEVSQFDRCYVYGGVVDLLTITINLSTFILSSSPSQHLSTSESQHLSNSVSLILFAWVPIHP